MGQEGLNFHPYCHAVFHWNLPSNPVDLEQREGRVHRYKGHAVRKTIAMRYRDRLRGLDVSDPWKALFDLASTDRGGNSDVIPFWVHGDPEGYRIERYVPVLPLSRDVVQFSRLRRSLALYRMVFGQPRQDDLIAYLLERMPVASAREQLSAARIDLHPPPLAGARAPTRLPAIARLRLRSPSGELGRAIVHGLDRYALGHRYGSRAPESPSRAGSATLLATSINSTLPGLGATQMGCVLRRPSAAVAPRARDRIAR